MRSSSWRPWVSGRCSSKRFGVVLSQVTPTAPSSWKRPGNIRRGPASTSSQVWSLQDLGAVISEGRGLGKRRRGKGRPLSAASGNPRLDR